MTTETDRTLTPRDYQDAVEVQSACNLSGVVFSFARAMQAICNETNGTEEKNAHPIAVLYASKIASLTQCENFETFKKAHVACTKKSR